MPATPATTPRTTRTALRRGLAAAAALPLLIGALASCGYGSQADGASDGGADNTANAAKNAAPKGPKLSTDTVRLGYFPNLTHATALVGEQEGILQKELGGTALKSTTFNAGPSEIEALNAGSIDIGFIGPSPAINGFTKSKGTSLRIVGGSASGGVKLVVNPAKIKTTADVKGKRIATPQLGNTQDVAFLNWASEQGWKVDAQSGKGDVSVVRTDNKVTPNAYTTGAIDGAWVPEPTASKLVSEGAKVLLDERDLWPDKQFVITNIIVSQKFLKEHPDVVEAVLRGSVKTNAWINAHPEQAKTSANDKLRQLSGKPLPADVLDSAWSSLRFTDDPLASTLRAQADHAVKAGLLAQPDLTGIYDLRPLDKVLAAAGGSAVPDAGLGVK
ncbi:aliphatic sulfonate ABC transporter substrate-binding protein [Streptomyces sp. NPDC048718]|uniref:aliphatic sulfonate ABC transporter substrate-binding protein n=1 Tax=Streptomyces sp. NPDC048718 TaxID=3365587 RepID=UPI0037249479